MSENKDDKTVAADDANEPDVTPDVEVNKAKSMQVRVLSERIINGKARKPNELVSLPTELVEKLESKGIVDSSKEAVAYAKKLEKEAKAKQAK